MMTKTNISLKKAGSSIVGIESIVVDMKESKMTVIGDVDPLDILKKLRKHWSPQILTVGPANQVVYRNNESDATGLPNHLVSRPGLRKRLTSSRRGDQKNNQAKFNIGHYGNGLLLDDAAVQQRETKPGEIAIDIDLPEGKILSGGHRQTNPSSATNNLKEYLSYYALSLWRRYGISIPGAAVPAIDNPEENRPRNGGTHITEGQTAGGHCQADPSTAASSPEGNRPRNGETHITAAVPQDEANNPEETAVIIDPALNNRRVLDPVIRAPDPGYDDGRISTDSDLNENNALLPSGTQRSEAPELDPVISEVVPEHVDGRISRDSDSNENNALFPSGTLRSEAPELDPVISELVPEHDDGMISRDSDSNENNALLPSGTLRSDAPELDPVIYELVPEHDDGRISRDSDSIENNALLPYGTLRSDAPELDPVIYELVPEHADGRISRDSDSNENNALFPSGTLRSDAPELDPVISELVPEHDDMRISRDSDSNENNALLPSGSLRSEAPELNGQTPGGGHPQAGPSNTANNPTLTAPYSPPASVGHICIDIEENNQLVCCSGSRMSVCFRRWSFYKLMLMVIVFLIDICDVTLNNVNAYHEINPHVYPFITFILSALGLILLMIEIIEEIKRNRGDQRILMSLLLFSCLISSPVQVYFNLRSLLAKIETHLPNFAHNKEETSPKSQDINSHLNSFETFTLALSFYQAVAATVKFVSDFRDELSHARS